MRRSIKIVLPTTRLRIAESQIAAIQHMYRIDGKQPNLVILKNQLKELEKWLTPNTTISTLPSERSG